MTPEQFLGKLKRGDVPQVCLFLGSEAYNRDRCRAALIDAVLTPGEREDGLTRYDLTEVALVDVIDDARALSLFATRRVIVATSAEAALPKGRSESDDDEPSRSSGASVAPLVEYLKDPTPDVFLLLESTRFDFEGEEKKKLERVRVFYGAVADTVELRRYTADDALIEARMLAKRAGVAFEPAALALLVESLGADVARVSVEIEKLRLYASDGRTVTVDDVAQLAPDARATTIFALVNALGRRDRKRSLDLLDTLVREGEYLPLALSFLSGQMRMALVAREAGLRTAPQVIGYFSKAGIPVWGSRAEQVLATVNRFSVAQTESALKLIFQTDRDLRDARPDDRTVMERLILALTA